jgi:hypothetical protein
VALSGGLARGAEIAAEAARAPATKPWEASALNVEAGMLWEVGINTPIAYRLVPVQLSWRSKEFIGRGFTDGSRIMIRNRFTLIGTWIQNGAESHYVGVSASPSAEWWNAAGTWSVFGGAGGGFGLIDSRHGHVAGGQGQDFTLNFFGRAGIEHVTAKGVRWSAGLMFQHLSNGGMTNPNPGIDAFGFTAGYSWAW